ncbi:hypothetical protein [Phenylobacterium montanum]|uniref:Transmembrane protein n=1 Tax=Phenylobacterium montanum TaxID=2823693 RepID=A0A975G3N9_9CAUL|nr:hypothetical protein [Caulobacter sp. S6]QUD89964.1 hypothetical protein KCG34_08900 [Caulobacter sp. S6]
MSENASSGRKSWWTWIRVSEVVGVIAVIIAILNFWDSHQERKATDQARQAADQRAAIAPAFVLVAAADANGERIRLTPVHADQPIQSQQFIFPTEIRAQPVETAGSARIEASWFEEGLRKAAGKGGGDAGDRRLPVGVTTTYLADGDTRIDKAVYDIGYRLEPRMLRSDRVVLVGLSIAHRNVRGDLKAAVEQAYKAR